MTHNAKKSRFYKSTPKKSLNNSRVPPSKTPRVLRQIAPESSPEVSAASVMSHKFLAVLETFLEEGMGGEWRLSSGGNKRDKLKGTNAQDSQFFADFVADFC